jgi:hypothetical protein
MEMGGFVQEFAINRVLYFPLYRHSDGFVHFVAGNHAHTHFAQVPCFRILHFSHCIIFI